MFPLSYTSGLEEHVNTRTNVGMQDISSMGEVDVKGAGAERLLNRLAVNEIIGMEPGQVRYTTLCDEQGGIVDDVTVYKFHDEHFMVVTSSGPRKQTVRWLADHAIGTSTFVTDISAAVALPVVQGPRSRELLRSVVQEADINRLNFFRFVPAVINGSELLLSRSGYTGELGFELYTPAEEAGALWEFLLQAGKEYGLQPYGVQAMNSLRVEKGFPLYGNDINLDYTPFHVGLDRWIRFKKRDFIGRDALLQVQESGIHERWVGLTLDAKSPANVNDPVYSIADIAAFEELQFSGAEAEESKDAALPGEPLGHVTISAKGHSVGKMLAMAYVRTTHAWPGSKMIVISNGRPVVATVTQTPFFDPGGARLRAKVKDGPERVAADAQAKQPPASSRRRSSSRSRRAGKE
jgi:aminomethyltransferase